MENLDFNNRGRSRQVETLPLSGTPCAVSRSNTAPRDALDANIIAIDACPIIDVDAENVIARGISASLPLAQLMCTTVIKRRQTDVLGIVLKNDDNGHLRVIAIKPDGLLRLSSLQSEDALLSVNNIDCSSLPVCIVTKMILQPLTGEITLVTRRDNGDQTVNQTVVEKKSSGQRIGLKIYRDTCLSLTISQIDETGLFAGQPLLKPGDKIVAINDIPCFRLDVELAADLIRRSLGFVKLLTTASRGSAICRPLNNANNGKDHSLALSLGQTNSSSVLSHDTHSAGVITTRATYVSATVFKSALDVKVGLALLQDDEGIVRILSINPKGSLSASPLRPNDRLLSINNVDCRSMSQTEATRLLRNLTGTIYIVAENEGGRPNTVESMVEKHKPDAFVGVAVIRNQSGRLVISKIKENGLLVRSLLNIGDRLISVNGHSCLNEDVSSVTGMIRSASQYVSIVAERHSSTAVVIAAASN